VTMKAPKEFVDMCIDWLSKCYRKDKDACEKLWAIC